MAKRRLAEVQAKGGGMVVTSCATCTSCSSATRHRRSRSQTSPPRWRSYPTFPSRRRSLRRRRFVMTPVAVLRVRCSRAGAGTAADHLARGAEFLSALDRDAGRYTCRFRTPRACCADHRRWATPRRAQFIDRDRTFRHVARVVGYEPGPPRSSRSSSSRMSVASAIS